MLYATVLAVFLRVSGILPTKAVSTLEPKYGLFSSARPRGGDIGGAMRPNLFIYHLLIVFFGPFFLL